MSDPDARRRESVVPVVDREQAADELTDRGARVDADVENRESAILLWTAGRIKRSHRRRNVRLKECCSYNV